MDYIKYNQNDKQGVAARLNTVYDLLGIGKEATGDTFPSVLAATKQQSIENIVETIVAGVRLFGENRVQEAEEKWPHIRARYPEVRLHLIGPLQTNKARDAVALFDCIETLDRKKLADTLAEEMTRQRRHIPCFIQVNIGKEPQKAGVVPEELMDFYDYCTARGLRITGLMCVPPVDRPPAPYFALMRKYARELELQELSMGMSGDFLTAAKFGATEIRLGTVLFGERA